MEHPDDVLDHHHRAIDDQAEVDGAEAHQVARDPAWRMAMKAASIDSGIADETINPPRRLPSRSSRSTTITRRPPSVRFLATVRIVRRTSSVRS